MSGRYSLQPIDLSGLHTISLKDRGGKVRVEDFAKPYAGGDFLASLPKILAGDTLRAVVDAIAVAKSKNKPILWGMGGHVIKCGLAPIVIDLMDRGFATGFAMNGSASIHDFEIALAGHTSEDVEAVLPDGRFGAAEETGRQWNEALRFGEGIGESLGAYVEQACQPALKSMSVLHAAWKRQLPLTVHVAIGTDTPHTHPATNPSILGEATHRDFRLFCAMVSQLNEGGVYINAGSAVIMPEVFLKAVSTVRNLGHPLAEFTTVNLDFIQHYRPRMNVVERPHAQSGGKGYQLTGHHEIMIPLIAAALIERSMIERSK